MRNLQDKIPGASSFKYGEFVRSEVATRLGIKNEPDEKQWQNIELLAREVLQPVRNKFGRIKITSGFRCEELNKRIGGSEFSNHCRGEAADIEPMEKGVTLFEVLEWIYENLEFRTVIAEFFTRDGWIHIDYRVGGNIKRLRLRDEKHKYEDVTMKFLKELYPRKTQNNSKSERCSRSYWRLFGCLKRLEICK